MMPSPYSAQHYTVYVIPDALSDLSAHNKAKNSKKLEGVRAMLQQFCGRVTTVHVRGDSL